MPNMKLEKEDIHREKYCWNSTFLNVVTSLNDFQKVNEFNVVFRRCSHI